MCWITSFFRCCRHGKNSVNTLMTRVIKCDFIVLSSSSFRRYSLFSNELMSGTRGLVLSKCCEGMRSNVTNCAIQCMSEFR